MSRTLPALILPFLLALCAATASILAGVPASAPAEADQPHPDEFPLIFDMPEIDLGEVSDAADVSHAFSFVNAGTRTVRVELRNFCHHCEEPQIMPSLVNPGQSGVVIVDIKTTGKVGIVRGSATVGVQGMTIPTIDLQVTATVVPDASFDPPMLQIGEVELGKSASGSTSLIVRTPGATIASSEVSSDDFSLELGQPAEFKLGDSGQIGTRIPVKVVAKPSLQPGYHVGEIRLRTAGGQTISLPVNVQVLPSLKATPADAGLGRLTGGQEFSTTITVASRDGMPVRLVSAGFGEPQVYTQGAVPEPMTKLNDLKMSVLVEEPYQVAKVTVSGYAPMSAGGYEFVLYLRGRQGPSDLLEVPIRFRVKF